MYRIIKYCWHELIVWGSFALFVAAELALIYSLYKLWGII
jgi:hypothetical protein